MERTAEDRSKNVEWILVGQQGEKRLIRMVNRRGGTRGATRGGAERQGGHPPQHRPQHRRVGSADRRGIPQGGGQRRGLQTRGGQATEREEQGAGPGGDGGRTAGQALKILYLNAQRIVGKIDELAVIAGEEDPDLILVTESWCNDNIPDAFLTVQG